MLGRNTTTPNTKIRLFFVDAAFLAMTTFAVGAHAQVNQQRQTPSTRTVTAGATYTSAFASTPWPP